MPSGKIPLLAREVVRGSLLNVAARHQKAAFLKQAINLHNHIMARITLIRHGKTEIPSNEKHDFDRSLILRGQQNSSAVGAFLREHKMLPQLVLVSSAARTRETYEFMRSEWPDGIAVKFIDELYEASADTLLTVILNNCDVQSNIAVVGHNPSLVILLNYMVADNHHAAFNGRVTEHDLSYFPTCCFADIGFEAPQINDIVARSGKLLSMKRVREL